MLRVGQVHDRVDREEPAGGGVVVARAQVSEAGGFGVVGSSDEALGAGPVGGLVAAYVSEGQRAALGGLLCGGVDGELCSAVVVGEGGGDASVVFLDGLVAAAEVDVSSGSRRGGALGPSDFGVAQVEGGLGGGAADQVVAVGVAEIFGDLVAAALDRWGESPLIRGGMPFSRVTGTPDGYPPPLARGRSAFVRELTILGA